MKKQLKDECLSLNSSLPKFEVKKLEERLETDPLAVSGLFDLKTDESSVSEYQAPSEWCIFINVCGED